MRIAVKKKINKKNPFPKEKLNEVLIRPYCAQRLI